MTDAINTTAKTPRTHRVAKGSTAAAHAAPAVVQAELPTNAAVLAVAPAVDEVIHGTAFYDLFDSLDEVLVHPMMKARVLSSMAWMLDTSIINTARSVFWDTQASAAEAGHIDNFNDFINAMANMRTNENYVEDLGFELGAGRLQQLSLMLKLSQTWHDKAEQSAVVAGIKYTPKSFEVLITSEKVQTVDVLTKSKLDALIDATFDGEEHTPEEVAAAKAMLLKQQQERMTLMHASKQAVAPAVLRIIAYGGYRDCDLSEFWQLTIESQVRLITAAVRGIDRTMTDLSAYKSITVIEYVGMIKEAKVAQRVLNEVLRSPRYANAG